MKTSYLDALLTDQPCSNIGMAKRGVNEAPTADGSEVESINGR